MNILYFMSEIDADVSCGKAGRVVLGLLTLSIPFDSLPELPQCGY